MKPALALLLVGATGCLEIGDPIYEAIPPPPPPPPELQLVYAAPADMAPDLPPGDPVVLVFDRNLRPGSEQVTLLSAGSPVADVEATYRTGMVRLRPAGGFAPSAEHALTLSAISGVDGAELAAPIVVHFSTTAGAGDPPRFDEIQAIWSGACAFSGCHAGPGAAAGLDLRPGMSHASAVGVDSNCGNVLCDFACAGVCDPEGTMPPMQIVQAGRPCHSCMLLFLRQGVMPARRPGEEPMPLPAGDIDRIERWILAGAPQ